jgi:hypothetical protein
MTPALLFRLSLLLSAPLLAGGCGRPFDVKTPPGLVELDDQKPRYDYRAVAPEGVVVGIRVVDIGRKGDLAFWTRATELRMRQLAGYALLSEGDVKSRDGTPGRELRFGHDENGKPYFYSVRLFVTHGRLYFVETGGPKDELAKYQPSLDWMQGTLTLD